MRQEAIWGIHSNTINNMKGENKRIQTICTKNSLSQSDKKNLNIRLSKKDRLLIMHHVGVKVVALVCLKQTANFLTNNHPISPRLQRCSGCIALMSCTGPADVLKKRVPAVAAPGSVNCDQLTSLAVVTDRR